MKCPFKAFSSKRCGSGGVQTTDHDDPPLSPSVKQTFSQPTLIPGFYGYFPTKFSIHFAGPSRDEKKTNSLLLATSENKKQHTPFYAVSFYKTLAKHRITLYSGPTSRSAPLGLAGNEKYFHPESILALPPPARAPAPKEAVEGKTTDTKATTQVERLKEHSSITTRRITFRAMVGHQAVETFELRSGNVLKDKTCNHTLVRIKRGGAAKSDSPGGEEEVIGTWTNEIRTSLKTKGQENGIPDTCKWGTFQFHGSGATGELGQYWTLMAVMTLLRMLEGQLRALDMVVQLGTAAGEIVSIGLDIAGV
ncbi:hypothetical protein PHISP_05737 [Aspergillus sp. HF37]|nr:hypothetical protein PHISP_05737 [Aspergillus sp. HF37]